MSSEFAGSVRRDPWVGTTSRNIPECPHGRALVGGPGTMKTWFAPMGSSQNYTNILTCTFVVRLTGDDVFVCIQIVPSAH